MLAGLVLLATGAPALSAQQFVTGLRDPGQRQDADFAKLYEEWTSESRYGSPLVDHLPLAEGIPTPKDVLGYYIGQPKTLTYYEDIIGYYRALAAASPRVTVETIGRSDEDRELVVVWVSSEANIANLQPNRDRLAQIADPRGLSDEQVHELIQTTKPHYHLMGGLHSGELGPPEMLMELAYRLSVETSPFISQIRDNVIVSITPVADPDGRDRLVDWFYRNLERDSLIAAEEAANEDEAEEDEEEEEEDEETGGRSGRGGNVGVPYWGRYVYHDNNRDINLSQKSMRAITDWYFSAHPPIMHDLHESLTLLYTYSGGPPQNPNLDPLLFGELRFFSNWELSQMTKWGMPGVYTHAFMDGWSPGYLGSVSYNHNGMMRMYETQSGRDVDLDSLETAQREEAARYDRARRRARRSGPGRRRPRRRSGRTRWRPRRSWRRYSDRSRWRTGPRVVSRHCSARGCRVEVHAPQQRELHADRRAVSVAAHVTVPEPRARELLCEDTQLHGGRQNRSALRLRDSAATRHDPRDHADRCAACAGHRSRPIELAARAGIRHAARRLVRHQAGPALRQARQEPARATGLPRRTAAHLRRQRLDHGPRLRCRSDRDRRRGDSRRAHDSRR
jgi:hypothetical protein